MLRTGAVSAAFLLAAVLWPSGGALADPSWSRAESYEYEAGGCKYERKSGPGGYKEERKCGRGPELAGGPPPWAPAHGYRRKHGDGRGGHQRPYEEPDHDRHVYRVPDLGIDLGRCNRDILGGVIGGVAGGVIGSRIGEGDTRTAATIGGTIIGVIVGGSIGRSMDRVDQACVGQVLEQAPPRHTVAWTNPDGGVYRVTPLRRYQGPEGRTCRTYRTEARIDGRARVLTGRACRMPDGSWQKVG